MSELTGVMLRDVLDYDQHTGLFRWRVLTPGPKRRDGLAGYQRRDGYWCISVRQRQYLAHQLAWLYMYDEWPSQDIDHANGNKADNRICNLRLATDAQNLGNAKRYRSNTSGFKGVSWNKSVGRWQANIRRNRKLIYLGCFDAPEEAHAAYCKAAADHFGEFARAA